MRGWGYMEWMELGSMRHQQTLRNLFRKFGVEPGDPEVSLRGVQPRPVAITNRICAMAH
jgi:hypothetical protein